MHVLLLLALFILPVTVTAQPKVSYQKGQLVESPLVVQHGFRDGRKTEIPLPKGRWSVRYVGETKSTHGNQGVNIWLEESLSGKVAQFLTFQLYETNGKNWLVGTSCDFLLSTPRGSSLSGGCFGLSVGGLMNNPSSAVQAGVRQEYARESVSIEKEAIWLKGIADRREGLAVYFNYAAPFSDTTKSHQRDFLARVRSGGTLPSSEAQLANWFRAYGQSIVDGVVGTSPNIQASILMRSVPELVRAATEADTPIVQAQTINTQSGTTQTQTDNAPNFISLLPACQGNVSRWTNCFGTQTFPNGYKYVGEFKDSRYNGQGAYTFANGNQYVGEWKDGRYNGQGTLTLASGDKYVSEFKDGSYNGQGTFTLANGDKHVGEFKDSKLNGQGIIYRANGTVVASGNWSNGNLANSFPVNTSRFPFNGPLQTALPSSAETDRLTADSQASRQQQQELEQRLAATTAEAQAAKRRQQELEAQLASAQSTSQTASSPTTSKNERRVALVIGNAAYKSAPLTNPGNDASDVAVTLRSMGFQTILVRDATLAQMRGATREFADAAASSEVALIFYAGHGIEAKGRNYVIPVNADIKHEYELEEQAYDASRWLEMLEGLQTRSRQRVNIVILDACRNNEFARSWRSSSQGLARMDAPTGTFVAFSTAPGRVALDGAKGQRNSPFTKNLLRAIQTPDVPIELMFKEVRRLVVDETKSAQVPWENSSLVGDFVFKRTK